MTERAAVLAPERYQVVSGSVLKLIAVLTMICDHVTKRLLVAYPAFTAPLWVFATTAVNGYAIGESIGRLAFPIFCFLLVEGFCYTRDRRAYGLRLAAFALISEVPFDLCRTLTPFDWSYQNVFVTLLISYLGLCAFERYRDRPALQAASVLALALASMGLLCDYGPRGYALVFIFYGLRSQALLKTVLGSCVTLATWRAGLAFIPINLYNGQRGFISGPLAKYAFYAIYPVHLLIIYLVRLRLGV